MRSRWPSGEVSESTSGARGFDSQVGLVMHVGSELVLWGNWALVLVIHPSVWLCVSRAITCSPLFSAFRGFALNVVVLRSEYFSSSRHAPKERASCTRVRDATPASLAARLAAATCVERWTSMLWLSNTVFCGNGKGCVRGESWEHARPSRASGGEVGHKLVRRRRVSRTGRGRARACRE